MDFTLSIINNPQSTIPLFYPWILFNLLALGLLLLDLRIIHRGGRVVRSREALGWSLFYVALAGVVAVVIYFWQGHRVALDFVTGYVVEVSLSADNLFIFLVIFKFFAAPEELQHRVLFWGIVGAMLMRAIFIFTGVGLIHHFHWIPYVLGTLLIYSGVRVCVLGEHKINPARNPLVKLLRRWIPVTENYRGGKFFVRVPAEMGRLYATPLLLVLLVIETSDLLFSVDSIPAVLAITLNAFIVYSSNVMAILGLRSMYFAVSGLIKIFRFLHYGLAVVLVLVGLKMLIANWHPVSTEVTLAVVGAVLSTAVVASILFPAKNNGI
ncbi:MAG TPA: TerC/Alx family metal homeostasis membrane protein [Verrucomicrobiae bacterium]|nr:TerC/Alx family metal homeostasis membrane protein [Verrucomicrobiae bacterium]